MASPDHALLARIPSLDAARWCALQPQLDSPLMLTRPDGAGCAASLLTPAGQRAVSAFDPRRHAADLDALQRHAITLVAAHEPDYPAALRVVPGAPAVLFVRGAVAALQQPQLAMVGSRHPTVNGARTARDLAFHFASLGFAITSGLAVGIDAASHGGALAATGITVAVCGTGLDRIYPAQHVELAAAICERGALVSEFPPASPPLAHHFAQRNRLISGLALGVLVVEAAARSGSLITARHAGEQGREVFAIPGSIHNPQSRGCHQLLRQGAVLVECAEDVLAELVIPSTNQLFAAHSSAGSAASAAVPSLDNPSEILLDALGFEPTSLDALITSTGLSSTTVASLLMTLENQGRVVSDATGRYHRIP